METYETYMQELSLRDTISIQNDSVGFVATGALVEHNEQLSATQVIFIKTHPSSEFIQKLLFGHQKD